MKKGFTIVELLAVIIIIGVLIIIIIPSVNKMISDSENDAYNFQINTIRDAAINFTIDYYNSLLSTENLDSFTIDLKLLKDFAFIETELKNPKTNKYFSDDTTITLNLRNGGYSANVFDLDSDSINLNSKYTNYFALIKNLGSTNLEDVIVFNSNGARYNDTYSLEVSSETFDNYVLYTYLITLETNEVLNIKQYKEI